MAANNAPQVPENPFILVDGSSYLFRAFYAPPHLTNSAGEPTGAIYGVVNMLRSLIKKYNPSHMAVVFDAKGKTFRNDMYEDYKANRPPMPDDLRSQIAPLHAIVKALGLPLLCIDNVEADDVIGTLARAAGDQGRFTLISTGDKDMAQLVNEHVMLINTMTDTLLNEQGVIDKYGVQPNQIIDYLALMGDSSDNIPGLPKVGEKTALAMLQGMQSIDAMYDDPEAIAKLGFRGAKTMPAKLVEHEQILKLSRELATIKLDVDLEGIEPEALAIQEADRKELIRLYKECEFRRWLDDVLQSGPVTQQGQEVSKAASKAASEEPAQISHDHYEVVTTEKQLQKWVTRLQGAEAFAFDTETTSLNYMEAELVGISFALVAGEAAYVPVAHDYPGAPEQLDRDIVLAAMKPLLENDKLGKIGQNLKYDSHILRRYDIRLAGIKNDTMLASYVYNSVGSRHDMDSLSLQHLGHRPVAFEDIAGKGAKQLTFNQIGLEQAAPYAAEDADVTLRLHDKLWSAVNQVPSLMKVLTELELPLVSILVDMEQRGVRIDAQLLAKQSNEIALELAKLEEQAYTIAGEEFNLGSPKQLQKILFEKLQLPVRKKTPKGAPSTAEEVLQELALDYPLPDVIMRHRGLSKLKSTYTDKLPKMVNPRTQRIHTSYHQAVTATGRLSSSDPNLQNIPIRTAAGRRVRQAFTAPEGYRIMAIDYSQIELRIMAHLSQDKNLLEAFSKGRDIHKATASEVFAVALEEVTSEQRRRAKAVNFGLIYGMSAFGLARQLDIPRHEAQQYMDKYFERFPGVQRYMEDTREQAKRDGYVETLFGRRLHLPEIRAQNGARRKAAERAAINAPMQGTAADIIKYAMIKVADYMHREVPSEQAWMVMQVHDELVFEVHQDHVEALQKALVAVMEDAVTLDVPLLAEAGVGDNWDEAH
ncbi:DNA polymerase I [Pseudidiomarina piscicola]|uniref:DNA polymerase I n=1 Tax=Pseudidiomarina piscicola TaxID=2614830 RepID=A0A6S6WL83_9GAMM|nr:DNA polymerase I [Pseudidiomarina piscicola]CAB0150815.1 DNA polymerase I [Pseudidiomarina piscicola]VZT40319.1 DNA polymerase I [Pseudomonas aeruginosa]